MHDAVKRVMTTQPAAKGRAASRLHSKYSMRSKGNVAGETDGPGPNAPKRSGRKGRGSETDRGVTLLNAEWTNNLFQGVDKPPFFV